MHNIQQALAEAAEKAFPQKRLVFGEGPKNARLCFIGEAPGAQEEAAGHPFVGQAGQHLTDFLERVGVTREEIYLTNVVKLRPSRPSPKTGRLVNRPPTRGEITFFLPFLHAELLAATPDMIVTLGNVPLQALAGNQAQIGAYHGQLLHIDGFPPIFALYHPAAVMYRPPLLETYHADLEKLKAKI